MKSYKTLTLSSIFCILYFLVFLFLIEGVSAKGGPHFYLKEYRKGDKVIGTVYINGEGLGTGNSITPKVMRVSVAQSGKILYQIAFFKVSENDQKVPEFTLSSGHQIPVGGKNLMKGIILFFKDETKEEATHAAQLLGEIRIGEDFLAYFTGWVVFADEQTVGKYRSWNWNINNKLIKAGNELILKEGDKIPITDNLLE